MKTPEEIRNKIYARTLTVDQAQLEVLLDQRDLLQKILEAINNQTNSF